MRERIEHWIRQALIGEHEKALAGLEEILQSCSESDPDNEAYALFAQGNVLASVGRHQEAVVSLRKAATLDHNEPSILFNLGMEEITLGNKQRGREYLERASQLGHDKAATVLEALRSDQPIAIQFGSTKEPHEIVKEHIERGMENVRQRRYADALIEYNRAIELAPDFGHTYTLRGVVFEALGRYEEALREHDRSLELYEGNALAYYNRGVAHERLGKLAEALKDYTRSIELDATDADAFYNRGNVRTAMAKFEESIEDFTAAIRLNPRYALAYNNRGNAYSRLQRFDVALDDYQKAVNLEPQEPLFQINKGACHYNRGEVEACVRHLLAAIALGDRRAEELLNELTGEKLNFDELRKAQGLEDGKGPE